jgi:flagellar protein FlaI
LLDPLAAETELTGVVGRNPHLGEYLQGARADEKDPEFLSGLDRDDRDREPLDVIYPVGDPIFIHLFRDRFHENVYRAIEPGLNEDDQQKYEKILDKVLMTAHEDEIPETEEEMEKLLERKLTELTSIGGAVGRLSLGGAKVPVSMYQFDKIKYLFIRDLIGHGKVEPLIRDPYIEDIHCVGTGPIFIEHKVFGRCRTSIAFDKDEELDGYVRAMSERIGKPVSDTNPIIDATLPDGSRINMVYSREISKNGSSFTIRKFAGVPISIVQLVNWKTLSAQIAAYLWLCLENAISIFVCGETASGKTTVLNAMSAFIRPAAKVFTVEDVAEAQIPHEAWQRLLTRETGSSGGRVEMFDLLKAALRSRPNYIIVGEIRSKEGAVAFQGMQTGHPVMATFHASSVRKMIQRLTGDPINVPETFIDNLNIALIQQAIYRGGKLLRRTTGIEEIEGYSSEAGGVLTRNVFDWVPYSDQHEFRGMYNSYILEEKIATMRGLSDKREIYEHLALRTRIIEEMVNRKIFDYYKVFEIVRGFSQKGVEALPFPL